MLYKELGERFYEIRKEAGLSQSEMGKRLAVTTGFISQIESGGKKPSDTLMLLTSCLFLYRFEWIKGGKGEKRLSPVDVSLLTEILKEIDFAGGSELPPEKRAIIAGRIYQTAIVSGQIDKSAIPGLISLAK